ncbi:FtsK/SpoIIIE domain-containing protein [Streptococcus suis]|uniref:FtsK/SpoIIIE domain-containing protein n=1 Tax=Streptococcus suis TaxID=1307 RepID=UPI002412822F|nr:FtsK/SpoIIIE domain-containing protein [Streptococcus suis]MDG4497580.1 FtsK/SpoIIIE domain-containing protein [Streptococcus suis]HEM2868409.1 cell division protein FtsK [Streptococcus suis]
MKLIKLNHAVRVRFNPYIITSKRLFLSRVGMDLFLGMLLINTWFSPCSIPVKSVLSLIFIGMIYSIEKIFRSTFIRKIQSVLYVRESLFDMLIGLNLYEESDNVVTNSATLNFEILPNNIVMVEAPLFGNKFLKLLKNLEEYLVPTLGLPLLSKYEFPDHVIYKLGKMEEIEQYIFNSQTLTRDFFEDIPTPIVKLSNTQQFSLKQNTNLGIYGRTGTGKTIALQWYLFNALAKGCGTNDTYLGIVDGKAADLFALGKLLQEDLGEQIAVGSSPQMLAKLSREFCEIMEERYEIIEQNSTLNADAYDLGMTPNFLFVDELASIRDSCGSSKQGKELWNEILQNLGLIARKGRQAGCHLCLSTQDPNAENIPVELRNQISAVLYLGNIGNDRLKMAFSMCELENVPTISDRKGEALFYADGLNSAEPVLTIVPFVDVKTKQDFLQVVRNILPNY